MVGFKKDNNKKDKIDNVKREITRFLFTFLSGFIIAVFLVLYIVMSVINSIRNNNNNITSEEDTTSEVISSSEEPSSSDEGTSVESSSNIYIEEENIYNHLLSASKEYDANVNKIITINYDTDYLYITLTGSDNYIYIFRGELLTDIELTLESLLTDGSGFGVTNEVDNTSIETLSSEDLTSKSDFTYSDYTYSNKINYYTDSSHDETALVSIGYKENNYISICYLRYISSSDSITDDEAYINTSSDTSSYYYSFLDYLYHRG